MPGKSACPGAFAPALDWDSFDGVALLYVIYIFQEVQVYLEAVRSFYRVRRLPFKSSLLGFMK